MTNNFLCQKKNKNKKSFNQFSRSFRRDTVLLVGLIDSCFILQLNFLKPIFQYPNKYCNGFMEGFSPLFHWVEHAQNRMFSEKGRRMFVMNDSGF